MTQKVKSKKPAMSAEQAEFLNPGGGNLILAGKRKAAELEKQVADVCDQLGMTEHLAEIRALPIGDRKPFLLQLNFAGLSVSSAAKVLGIGNATASRWFHEEPEAMQRLVRATLTSASLQEVGPTWQNLVKLRGSDNQETSRKASLDLMRVAGMGVDGPAGMTVQINAKNAQFNALSLGDIEAQLRELGRLVGPEAEKLVDAEIVSAKDLNGTRKHSPASAAVVQGGSPGNDPAPAPGAAETETLEAD